MHLDAFLEKGTPFTHTSAIFEGMNRQCRLFLKPNNTRGVYSALMERLIDYLF